MLQCVYSGEENLCFSKRLLFVCVFPDTVREICVMAYEDLRGRLGGSFGYKLNDSGKVTDRKTIFCKLCGKSFSYT